MADQVWFFFLASSRTAAGIDFSRMVSFRVKEILRQIITDKQKPDALIKPPAVLRFLHFDFFEGTEASEIRAFQLKLEEATSRSKAETLKWSLLSKFDSGSDAGKDTDPKVFVHNVGEHLGGGAISDDNKLSVVHLYHSVRGAPVGSVIEVGFYSHAFLEGPILVDTDDYKPGDNARFFDPGTKLIPQRRPEDRDCRHRADFARNMGEDPSIVAKPTDQKRYGGKGQRRETDPPVDAIEEFRAAFHKQATFRIHGCNIQDRAVDGSDLLRSTAREVLNEFFINISDWKTKPPASVRIDMKRQFDDENDERTVDDHKPRLADSVLQKLHYAIDLKFFPQEKTTGDPPTTTPPLLTFDVTFAALRGFIARRIQDTYAYKTAETLTKDTDIRIFFGLPGTSSENRNEDYLYIPSRFIRILEFCNKYLGVPSDTPIKRGYGVLNAVAVTSIASWATS